MAWEDSAESVYFILRCFCIPNGDEKNMYYDFILFF